MEQKRKTVGQIYLDMASKEPEYYEAEEIRREVHKKYESAILECVTQGKKAYGTDFFIEVQEKKERLMPNVNQRKIIGRRTCPLPFYDQTVYRYHFDKEEIEFLWVVPTKDTCIDYKANMLQTPTDEKELLYQVLSFYDGTLLEKQAELNSELYRKEANGRANITGRSS